MAREGGTLGDSDRDQLADAVEHDWVLLRFDDDFLSLVEGEGLEHAGIVFVRQKGRQIGDVVNAVDAHLHEWSGDDYSIESL